MLYKTILGLSLYTSLGIAMQNSDSLSFMGVSLGQSSPLNNSSLRDYCNKNRTQDCIFLEGHLRKSNEHKSLARHIKKSQNTIVELSEWDLQEAAPSIQKLKEMKNNNPHWHKPYWNSINTEEQKKIAAAVKNSMRAQQAEDNFPDELYKLIRALNIEE